MANREKGEISVVIDGVSYTFVRKFKALAEAEAMASTPTRRMTWGQIERGLIDESAECVAIVCWALLHTHHPTLTLDDVYALLDKVGVDAFGQAIQDAMVASAPDPRDAQVLGPRPRKARTMNGTGETTSSPPVASV